MAEKTYDEWGGESYAFLNVGLRDLVDLSAEDDPGQNDELLTNSMTGAGIGYRPYANFPDSDVPSAEEIVDAINDRCGLITVACNNDQDETIVINGAEVLAENLGGGIFRVTISDEQTPSIVYKLDRWALTGNEDDTGSGDSESYIAFMIFSERYGTLYGLCAINPFDWYYRLEKIEDQNVKLQILFNSDFVSIGGYDNEGEME